MGYNRNAILNIVSKGSQIYEYNLAGLAAGAEIWLHMEDIFPQARAFLPLDYLELINNSAQNISLYLGSITEVQTVPSYMIKPIARKSFSQLGIKNIGLAATNADEIILHVKRLPPNVQVVVGSGYQR